jgi:hypothetical protein
MKSTLRIFLLCLTAVFIIASCKKDDNDSKLIVKMGAQSNTTIGAFYSIGMNKVYTQAQAYANQDTIDMLCFYELTETSFNYTTIASPGSGISGIFTGDDAPANWTTAKTTRYCVPAATITVEEFDNLEQNDAVIPTYYNADVAYRKEKNLAVDDIYAFKTQDGIYGLLKVVEVVAEADGYVQFELKLKK